MARKPRILLVDDNAAATMVPGLMILDVLMPKLDPDHQESPITQGSPLRTKTVIGTTAFFKEEPMVPAYSRPSSSSRRFLAKFVSFILLLALIAGASGGAPAQAQGVVLIYLRATPVHDQILIEWETAFELDAAGFWLQRSLQPDSGFVQLPAFIPAQGDGVSGASYSFADTAVIECVIYYYTLEFVGLNGASEIIATASASACDDSWQPNVWISIGPEGGSIRSMVIDPATPTTLYATTSGGVFKSINGGGSWDAANTGLPSGCAGGIVAVDPVTPTTLYLGTDCGLYQSTDGGEHWSAADTGLPFPCWISSIAIDPLTPTTVYVGTDCCGVFKGTNGGENWSAVNSGLTSIYVLDLAIDPVTSATLYAATHDGGVFKSVNSGDNWSAVNDGLTSSAVITMAIDPVTPTTLYAATHGAGVFKSTNGGGVWFAVNTGLPDDPNDPNKDVGALAIDPVSAATLYAGTWGRGAFRSANGGEDWVAVNTGLTSDAVSALVIDPTTPASLYAGTDGAGVFKSTNSGGAWGATNTGLPPSDGYIGALAIDPVTPSTLYAGTGGASMHKSINGGGSWRALNVGLISTTIRALAIDPETPTTLYAGTNDSVLKSMDGGESWNAVKAGLPAVEELAIDPMTPATLYAGTWGGGVFKSTDGGQTWTAVNTGLTDTNVRALAIDPVKPTTLYAGTHEGGVFKRTDGGNWEPFNTGLTSTEVRALAIDPTNPNILYAGTAMGHRLYKSTDGGESWSAGDTGIFGVIVEALVIDPLTPATLYAGIYEGGVFKSTNAGGDWRAFNAGLTATRVHALAIDPKRPMIVYAGTDRGMFGIHQVEMKYRTHLPLIAVSPTFTTCEDVGEIPRSECDALIALYHNTNGPGWTRNDGWLVANAPCTWYGVTCRRGHVSELVLNSNGLRGMIPPKLGDLAKLHTLKLGGNQLTEVIPPELGMLSNLQILSLDGNQLSGVIPAEFDNLPFLRELGLSSNQLCGNIPPELGNLTLLGRLSLARNQLSGSIPPELGKLANLKDLSLGSNQLSSAIPPELGKLANLWFFWLDRNQVSGAIPAELGNLTRLVDLSLSSNQLSGAIPPDLGKLVGLFYLALNDNQLSGAIPPDLSNLARLHYLALNGNQLSGTIPPELGELLDLQILFLNDNQFSGPLPRSLMNLHFDGFHFNNTYLCEPPDSAFQAWLADISGLQRTGVRCSGYRIYLPLVFALPPTNGTFWADRDRLDPGECTTLHWSVTNATAVYLNDQGVAGQGSQQVCPAYTQTYILRVERASGTQEYLLTIVVGEGDLPDLQGRKVVAVTENAFPPLNFVDPATGRGVGWEYDAMNEICRRLNCTVDWKVSSWDALIPAVKAGQFDVGMDGITITDERKTQVDFSDPYMTSQQFMLARAGEARFKDAKAFAANDKLLIGSKAGTTSFYTAVHTVLDGDERNPRIKLFETFRAAVQGLLAGDVDMVVLDRASARGHIGANPDQLKIIGDPLVSEEFGFIFTPKSDLVSPFNAAIDTLKKDGFLDHLDMRWFFLYDPPAN